MFFHVANLAGWKGRSHFSAGGAYPEKELHEGWEVILRNQFHDILPGSSIKEVYDDSKAEYEGIFAENKALTDATLAHIAAGVKAPKHISGVR